MLNIKASAKTAWGSIVNAFLKHVATPASQAIGRVHWAPKNPITDEDRANIEALLKPHYYVILTRRRNHLSTYFINLSDFLLSGKWGYYSHALMNTEDVVDSQNDFKLIEAIGNGVVLSDFAAVFDCNSVALLKPKSMTLDEWTTVMDKAKTELGKPYDNVFDLKSDSALSCVELVRVALMAEPNYARDFAHFEELITKRRNLTPQMFYECDDFEVVFEVRR